MMVMDISDGILIAYTFATLLLAGAAFWSIGQNHTLQKRERRERLLNEIIEWAEDINNASLTSDISPGIKQLQARETDVLTRYGTSVTRAISIVTVTSASFKEELLDNVQEVIDTLFGSMCISQLTVLGTMPTKEEFPETVMQEIEREITEGKTIDELEYTYANKLTNSVHNLLISANKIKTRDIS